LWHWPFLAFARYVHSPLSGAQLTGLLVLSGVIAALSWRFVEQPARRGDSGGLSYRQVLAPCGIASLVVVVFCLGVQATQGFRNRFTPLGLAYLESSEDHDPDAVRCGVVNAAMVLRNGLCRFGPASVQPVEFLVWGDSHAIALMPLFRRLAAEYGVVGLIAGAPGCAPVMGVNRVEGRYQCRHFNDSVHRLILRDAIKTVFLVDRWSRDMRGPAVTVGDRQARFRTEKGGPASESESRTVAEHALRKTVSTLTSVGVNVYIMSDVPNYSNLMIRVQRAAASGQHLTQLGMLSVDYLSARRELDTLFAQLVANYRIQIIDPGLAICSQPRCAVGLNGRMWYQDDHHLTATGALMLKPLFEPIFEAMRHRSQ